MWSLDEIGKRFVNASLSGGPWGCRGSAALERIENGLGIRLGQQLREFILALGNLRVDPFNIIVAGDDAGRLSALTQTQHIWSRNSELNDRKTVQVMEHAGEVYLYFADTEQVRAYDYLRPVMGEETLQWDSLSLFVDWVFQEAEFMRKNGDMLDPD